MPASKPKSKVAKSAKKSSFKFRWWYAAIAVLVIAVVGIVVIRLSHASGPTYTDFVKSQTCNAGTIPHAVAGYGDTIDPYCELTLNSSGHWYIPSGKSVAFRINVKENTVTCANISSQGYVNNKLLYVSGGKAYTSVANEAPVTVAETGNIPWNSTCTAFK